MKQTLFHRIDFLQIMAWIISLEQLKHL